MVGMNNWNSWCDNTLLLFFFEFRKGCSSYQTDQTKRDKLKQTHDSLTCWAINLCPRRSLKWTKVSTECNRETFSILMRRRGRIAINSPVVLGGPIKGRFSGIQFAGTFFCAFLAGSLFIIWLLLAWTTPSLCIGHQLTSDLSRTSSGGNLLISGIWLWFSVWAASGTISSHFCIWLRLTEVNYDQRVLHLQLRSQIVIKTWQSWHSNHDQPIRNFRQFSKPSIWGGWAGFGFGISTWPFRRRCRNFWQVRRVPSVVGWRGAALRIFSWEVVA